MRVPACCPHCLKVKCFCVFPLLSKDYEFLCNICCLHCLTFNILCVLSPLYKAQEFLCPVPLFKGWDFLCITRIVQSLKIPAFAITHEISCMGVNILMNIYNSKNMWDFYAKKSFFSGENLPDYKPCYLVFLLKLTTLLSC